MNVLKVDFAGQSRAESGITGPRTCRCFSSRDGERVRLLHLDLALFKDKSPTLLKSHEPNKAGANELKDDPVLMYQLDLQVQ